MGSPAPLLQRYNIFPPKANSVKIVFKKESILHSGKLKHFKCLTFSLLKQCFLKASPICRNDIPAGILSQHFHFEHTAFHQLPVSNERAAQAFAVKADARRMTGGFGAWYGTDYEPFPQRQKHSRFGKQRPSDSPFRLAGTHLVKPQSRKDIPCRHLPAILVTGQTVGSVRIKRLQDRVYNHLRTVVPAGVVVKVRNVMARFVAVCILPDKPCDVGRNNVAPQLGGRSEEAVKPRGKGTASAHEAHQAGYIVRHKPTPLPRCSLTVIIEAVFRAERIKRSPPTVPAVASAHKARPGIEIMAVSLGHPVIFSPCAAVAGPFGQTGRAPVVIGIFQSPGHTLVVAVARNVA